MTKNRLTGLVATAAAIGSVGAGALAVAGSATAKSAHGASAAAVKVSQVMVKGSKHSLLVNASGHPVYLLTGDSTKKPLCKSSGCMSLWPMVTTTATKPALGKGVKGRLTVWTHGGKHQLVLNGHPLYTFASDSGSTANGQGIKSFGGTWDLLTASGAAYTGKSSSGGGGGGGGGWS